MDIEQSSIIESIGVYLPPKVISTNEIMEGCRNSIQFPLEHISGIKNRRMAGETEFSIDLAGKAIEDCFARSKYHPGDIELLICCNISRWDGPGMVSFEPATSTRLKKQFGLTRALAFDVANACAGMFTGILLVNAFIRNGVIRRGMVVSGEYITHLTQTAQREIESFMDSRLACLTLGDGAAALILEESTQKQTGFKGLDIQTFGKYSPYCIARAAAEGGFIMHTDSVNLTNAAIRSCASHSMKMLKQANWSPDSFHHLIMHQTSRMTLNSASREINRLFNSRVSTDENTVNNLEHRGNTASTAHFIALADQIRNNKIHTGDKIVFSISASGLTIGTALYVLDDLPDRLRQNGTYHPDKLPSNKEEHINLLSTSVPRVRIKGIGLTPAEMNGMKYDSLQSLTAAAKNCMINASYDASAIRLLIYTGIYRSDYLLEPAYASLLAGELDMNATVAENEDRKTLAFDIFNGAAGFLKACYVAQQMMEAENYNAAMVVASECEHSSSAQEVGLLGIREVASAMLLDTDPAGRIGFSRFLFGYDLQSQDAYCTCYKTSGARSYLSVERSIGLEELYIKAIVPAVEALLHAEGLDMSKIKLVFPPQISGGFIRRLQQTLQIPADKIVDAVGDEGDLFSSSLPYALDHAYQINLVETGDIGLLISVGSGLQVGCAIYHF